MNSGAIEKFIDSIKEPEMETNRTNLAVVSRVDDEGIVWVNLAGAEKETPTASTSAEVKSGDVVNVEWRNNKLYIAGNYSNPSAGVVRVANVEAAVNTAREAANNAVADAGRARDAAEQAEATAESVHGIAVQAQTDAEQAKASAENASEYAARALGNLSTVQSVTETLNWITQHGTMTLTSDVALDPTHVYFVRDANGDYHVGSYYYSVVTEPDVADIGTYYELSIDESLNNYVGTHLALTSEGLWLIPEVGGNKVLIATGGTGHTYEDAGTYIIDENNDVLAQFLGSGAQIGQIGESHLEIDYHSLQMIDGDANPHVFFHVSDLRDENNEYAYTETFIGNGTTTRFSLAFSPKNRNVTVTVSDGSGGTASISEIISLWLQFETAPSDGAIITVSYVTSSYFAKAYTLGMRKANSVIGPLSTCFGLNCTASESRSFAEGWSTEANGPGSHAEGYKAKANGSYSHAQGNETVANRAYQVAIGRFNKIDNNGLNTGTRGKYAFIIGNGTADDTRSNALTVDWSGDVCLALDTTAASGTTDGDLYAAITALGWQSDVID